jgi:hypothetical protein
VNLQDDSKGMRHDDENEAPRLERMGGSEGPRERPLIEQVLAQQVHVNSTCDTGH